MSGLYDCIRRYKHVDLTPFVRVTLGGRRLGWTKRALAVELPGIDPTLWHFAHDTLDIRAGQRGRADLTAAIDASFFETARRGITPRKPEYPDGDDWFAVGGPDPVFTVRRFFSRFLGVRYDSVFVNGFDGGDYCLSIRGSGVEQAAGAYDVLVAGARQHHQTLQQAVIHEGAQEAGIDPAHAARVKHVSTLRLYYHGPYGFLKDEEFNIHDFDFANSFTPRNDATWEVAGFHTLPLSDLLRALETTPEKFKGQIILILVDFLIRHGLITPQYPDFDRIHATLYERIDFHDDNNRFVRP
jgi:hypothetical protein